MLVRSSETHFLMGGTWGLGMRPKSIRSFSPHALLNQGMGGWLNERALLEFKAPLERKVIEDKYPFPELRSMLKEEAPHNSLSPSPYKPTRKHAQKNHCAFCVLWATGPLDSLTSR